ncbi:hypothetical protein ANCDUO_22708 [Ancylostoma duodenale]|uniref:Uncharacterized protein n=1 Tax=Ancylostoma duodenale TaxID=51022 RepID=A0A0C2FF62_9BILA|nr:hypothetical protein ANCDUO_22708 [Ancylostoma duodenale]
MTSKPYVTRQTCHCESTDMAVRDIFHQSHLRKVHGVLHNYGYKERRNKVFVCEECGFTSEMFDVYVSHLKMLHPFSASLIRLSAPPKKLQVRKCLS